MPTSGTSPEDQKQFQLLWKKNGGDRPGCIKLVCKQCGKTFYASLANTKYCTNNCVNLNAKARAAEKKAGKAK